MYAYTPELSSTFSSKERSQRLQSRPKAQSIMAESNPTIPPQMAESEGEQRLKYLHFVQGATLHALMCFAKLYGYAKDNSGPLKPGVETVEGTVKTVVGPVVDKFHGVPIELLKFVDSKVDNASGLAKDAYVKYEPAAKGLYIKYEPVLEQCAVSAWRSLSQLPFFPQVAEVVIPTAAYCSEKYNETVRSTAEKGFKVATFLPLVPTEKIAKVFAADATGTEPLISSAGEEGAVAAR